MAVEVGEVSSRRDLKTFIYLPEKIHQGHLNWVPPLYVDEWKYFDRSKNKAFAYCPATLLLAWRDGRPVGRAMGIINSRFNEFRKVNLARFGYLETAEDPEIVQALLARVEAWARGQGMTRIIGPYGFSDQDPEGLLIEGFENRATIATYYNFEWLPRFIENEGYVKDIDYLVYKVPVPRELPDFYRKIYERGVRRGGFEVIEFGKRQALKPWIRPILNLMNECYTAGNIYGFAPLDEKEMDNLAKRYLPILDPRFVKAVVKNGEVLGFIVGIPDLTVGIQKARGRLFPFGFIPILRAAKKTRQLDLLLGAVKEKHRGQGIDVLFGARMLMSAREAGMEFMDSHHEMESNVQVRAIMERMGGKVYKRFRVYQKSL
jgi:GNAT superfamily N-acetyltransferase